MKKSFTSILSLYVQGSFLKKVRINWLWNCIHYQSIPMSQSADVNEAWPVPVLTFMNPYIYLPLKILLLPLKMFLIYFYLCLNVLIKLLFCFRSEIAVEDKDYWESPEHVIYQPSLKRGFETNIVPECLCFNKNIRPVLLLPFDPKKMYTLFYNYFTSK